MTVTHNVNEKQRFQTHNNNDNNNDIVQDKYARARKVETIADKLVEKFNNPAYREFYCKIAWKLSEARIWHNYETAITAAKNKGSHPGRLFSYLCKRDGV